MERDSGAHLVFIATDLDDFSHGFVTDDVTLFHRRNKAVENMKIRTTDSAGGDADNCITPVRLEWWGRGRSRNGCRPCHAKSTLSSPPPFASV
jgi:hypothetical protein